MMVTERFTSIKIKFASVAYVFLLPSNGMQDLINVCCVFVKLMGLNENENKKCSHTHHKVGGRKRKRKYKMGAGGIEGRILRITPIILKYSKLFTINRQYALFVGVVVVTVQYFTSI